MVMVVVMMMVAKVMNKAILYVSSPRCYHICLLYFVFDSDAVLNMWKPTGGMLTRRGVVNVTSRGLATA